MIPSDPWADPNAPVRIQSQTVHALSQLTCVRRIVAFGSIPQGRHDAWSDVDLWVVCAHAERTAWVSAALLRRAVPVAFYRKFTRREQPSGRYWFAGESPMNRLDISFDTQAEYEAAHAEGIARDPGWAEAELYTATVSPDPDQDEALAGRCHPLALSAVEAECGRRLYVALEAVKLALRGKPLKWGREESVAELQAALASCGRHPFAGGDFRAVAQACLRLNDLARDRGTCG